MDSTAKRMPVAFVTHGGGPWPVLELGFGFPAADRVSLLKHLGEVPQLCPTTPRALVVISAHWEEPVPTVMSSPAPPMLFDYSGFPRDAYALDYPAPGDPVLAARVRTLVEAAGFRTAEDRRRGYDHGTFVPLKVAFPEATIPVVQLSLIAGLDPVAHLNLGRALAPLRDEGVFIIGTGNSFHNLPAVRSGMQAGASPRERSAPFDAWLKAAVSAAPADRDAQLAAWSEAPAGRYAHPREEHLIPLMVAAGAAGADRGATTWTGALGGFEVSSFHFG